MAQSLSQLFVHIVFHVNINDNVKIPEALQSRLHAYLMTICNNHDSPSIIVGGTDDHIHILCRISKNIAPSKFLAELKATSSKWVKSVSPEFGLQLSKFSWQKGYGIFSVSASQVDIVKQYIANQSEHHRTRSFMDEYVMLLEKHGIVYDEKYLWS